MWQKWEPLSGRTHGKPMTSELGGLGDSGDWKIREFGKSGRLGNSGDWEIRGIRETRRFGRVGNSGDWEKSLYVAKIKNPLAPRGTRETGSFGRFGKSGRFWIFGGPRRLGRFGRFGKFGGLGDSGDSEDWGKSSYVEKIENPLELRRIREIGRFRRLGRFGRLGKIIICGEN